jgi:hypothetical protein
VKSLMTLFFVLFLFPQMAQAFNGSRCAKFLEAPNYMGKTERQFAKMFLSTTSTFQYITSTGKCKMLGGISESEKKQFVAHNTDHLKKNIIRAEGDYLSAMTYLYGCDQDVQPLVALRLQESTQKIFGNKLEYDANKVTEELDVFMRTDKQVQVMCSNSRA